MSESHFNLVLADDDVDDCMFFKEALEELPLSATLSTVNDGIELMNFLASETDGLPDILFLDLNMPRKSGTECLSEIKFNNKLKHIPVVIFSTAFDMEVVDLLYQTGAHHYIRKPGEYFKLKQVIFEAFTLTTQSNHKQPPRDQFVLQT